jgi:hypothetical protein
MQGTELDLVLVYRRSDQLAVRGTARQGKWASFVSPSAVMERIIRLGIINVNSQSNKYDAMSRQAGQPGGVPVHAN